MTFRLRMFHTDTLPACPIPDDPSAPFLDQTYPTGGHLVVDLWHLAAIGAGQTMLPAAEVAEILDREYPGSYEISEWLPTCESWLRLPA